MGRGCRLIKENNWYKYDKFTCVAVYNDCLYYSPRCHFRYNNHTILNADEFLGKNNVRKILQEFI